MNSPHTISRSKIGSHLSYPVKLSELFDSLFPAMEQLGIGVRFSAFFPPRKNETRDTYMIIEASYDPQEESSWKLDISAVPRALREDIRSVLLPALMAQIRAWLVAERKPGWHSTYHALRCRFDSQRHELVFQEHNAV